ncbi:hypothetical protein BV20DRAFT_1125314 [Pilatotrama ljubarskyi]|nr:hypothetical protein BV20DRAFT_1125314 [Pilatotrama ljubarskyi]
MWLLNAATYQFLFVQDPTNATYAILSHVWNHAGEQNFQALLRLRTRQGSSFRRSVWFSRGWTLQELIVPRRNIFLSDDWRMVGTKGSLAKVIEELTGIDLDILLRTRPLHSVSVARRMSWASQRETTRVEDQAYCLMGIFGTERRLSYDLDDLVEYISAELDAMFGNILQRTTARMPSSSYTDMTYGAGGQTIRRSSQHPRIALLDPSRLNSADFRASLVLQDVCTPYQRLQVESAMTVLGRPPAEVGYCVPCPSWTLAHLRERAFDIDPNVILEETSQEKLLAVRASCDHVDAWQDGTKRFQGPSAESGAVTLHFAVWDANNEDGVGLGSISNGFYALDIQIEPPESPAVRRGRASLAK